MPAMMPARSCSPPSVAETLLTSETSKASGRAPYFSVLASSFADFWVKLPVISARPPGIGFSTRGAEIAMPSSTIANWFCGGCLAERAVVAVSNSRPPSALNSRFTCHAMPFCGMPAAALASWSPSISVGPSRYFSVPVWSQANRAWSGTSFGLLVAGELRERGLAGLGRLPLHRLVRRRALRRRQPDTPCRRLRRGGRQRRERLVVAARAGLRARRRSGGRSRAGARLGRGFCARATAGRSGGLGRRRRLHLLGRVHGPEAEQRRLADQTDQFVLLHVRHGDDDLPVAGGDHLGLADAQAVHPVLDDRLGQLQAVRVDGPLPVVFCAVNVIVVPPCRSRPSFGVQALYTAISADQPERPSRRARSGCGRDGRSGRVLPRA